MGDKLPEAAFGVEEVTAALQTLREERGRWGIPVLPEVGMGVAADGPDQTCFADPHPDHRVAREHSASPTRVPVLSLASRAVHMIP